MEILIKERKYYQLQREELYEGGYIPPTLPKKIFTEENDNKLGGNTKKSYTEILKNAKAKKIMKVVKTESYLTVEQAQT